MVQYAITMHTIDAMVADLVAALHRAITYPLQSLQAIPTKTSADYVTTYDSSLETNEQQLSGILEGNGLGQTSPWQRCSYKESFLVMAAALDTLTSLPWRDRVLESSFLSYRKPLFAIKDLLSWHETWNRALLWAGYDPKALEEVLATCDNLHPIFVESDQERLQDVKRYIKSRLRILTG
jgi:hypothetical protein